MKKVYLIIFSIVAVALLVIFFGGVKKMRLSWLPVLEGDPVSIKGTSYFVAPNGNDSNNGLSEDSALATIQNAVDRLEPGDGVILADGIYLQDFITRRDGTTERPIVVRGSKKAVVKGSGQETKIIGINHDYHILSGFSVDGLDGDAKEEKNYRDKLIYVQGNDPLNGVTGLKILDMDLKNAGGECLRLKYFAEKNEVAHSRITGCGAYDFIFDGGGKNGEGVYVGTAPEQVKKDKNPTQDVDRSDGNWIHDNFIDTQGNECVDVKEGSSGNIIENNLCTGQKDKESAGLDSRGNGNIFRNNESYGNMGAGIRLGGDKETDGVDNSVMDNYLHDNQGGGIKVQQKPQKRICGNRFADNKKDDLVGEYREDVKNQKSCN